MSGTSASSLMGDLKGYSVTKVGKGSFLEKRFSKDSERYTKDWSKGVTLS